MAVLTTLREWLHRLRGALRRGRRDPDLEAELRMHLELAAEEARRRGQSHGDAARAVRLQAGNVPQAMEALRDQRGLPWLDDLARDLRHALRNLGKARAFAVVTVSTLALGIGANTAIFSIVNAALLRPLPYPEPDRLIAVYSINPSPGGGLWTVAPADYRDWREQSATLEDVTAYSGSSLSLWTGERPEAVAAARVTTNFFDTLGMAPLFGRGFRPDDQETSQPGVVLSHRFWQSRFGGDAGVVGTSIRTADGGVVGTSVGTADGSVRVIGVMPPEFEFPDYADVWMPMGCCGEIDRRATRYWQVVGRLRDGVSLDAARDEMEAIAARLAEQYPIENRGWSAAVMPFDRALVRDIRQALWILMGAVGFVVVIACANVAGLTLARSAARRREVAVRLALGATRWRIVRQLFVEGLVVALIGTAGGVAIAKWSLGALFGLLPETTWTSLVRFRDSVELDGTVLLFTALLSAVTAVVLTLVPVWDSRRLGLAESVRTGGNKGQSRREHRGYKTLVVSQVACAIVLLSGAGLLIQSFVRMLEVDYGYDPRGLFTMSLPLPLQELPRFVDETLEELRMAPGVESAAVMSYERFGQLNFPFNIEDEPLPNGDVTVRYSSVTADYFDVLRAPVVAGRVFEPRDSANAPGVAVINETLARVYFADEDPVGRTIVIAYNNQRIPRRIIGVVADIRQDPPSRPIQPEILVHWPQLPWMGGTLLIRTRGDAGRTSRQVQQVLWTANRNLPASRIQTLEDILSSQVATPRLYMILLGLFAAVAVALAVLGIYGLLAYTVARRTREMAIRLAVGAGTRTVVRMVIGEGLRLSVTGIALGLTGTAALTRLMQGLLFEVTPTDPLTLAGVTLLLLAAASAATYVPARRAARTDPMAALRQD